MKLTEKLKAYYAPPPASLKPPPQINISGSLNQNADELRRMFDYSSDLTLKLVGSHALIASLEGLADKELITVCITNRLELLEKRADDADKLFLSLKHDIITCSDVKTVKDLNDAVRLMMSGFACVFLKGCTRALAVGVQGYAFRSIEEPQTEVLQRGSREGFVEPIKINLSMLRRRLKTTDLKFESITVGSPVPTDIALCYMRSTVPDNLLKEVRKRIGNADPETVFTAGFLSQYLESGGGSLFNAVGVTERPDTACAKLCEGKILILTDGTPTALIVPHLMAENFSTLDDYSDRAYFSFMTRWLKYAAFVISVMLPGTYVALANFDPEFFPDQLLTRVTTSISKTPFSVFTEVLLFTFIYEIMREAGLRLPKTLGHAVSIIGGLVIGDTAVSSGFIGAPTLMIVALTVICSYVIPDLYAPISALRLLFIIFGGIWGVWGIVLMLCVMTADLCARESFGTPFMLPLAPFDPFGLRDVLLRAPLRVLSLRKYVPGGVSD